MQYLTTSANPARRKHPCAVVGVFENRRLSNTAKLFDEAADGLISSLLRDGDISGRAGETHLVSQVPGLPAGRLLLVGCGKADDWNAEAHRKAVHAAFTRLARTRQQDVLWTLARDGVPQLDAHYVGRQSAEAIATALYRFDELKGKPDTPAPRIRRVTLALESRAEANRAEAGLAHGAGVAVGIALARDLANRPANVCTPTHMAREARALASRHRNMDCDVLSEAQMKRLGMGALLSVTQGTEQPAKLIVLRYRGAPASQAPLALVGKAITFDTGGISIKPPPGMDEMKFDMGGGAAVLGAMAAIGELRPAINVVAIVPACENMPSGRATRPGDIVRSMSGKTIEILNTDAEGRLILCDALTYARRFKPDTVIDAATLTGACVIALGHQFTAVFSPDDALAAELVAAGERVGDPGWRMPVNAAYGESLKSNFADFANVGVREGGASIAAAFLSRFTEGLNWAHLDIAGAAWRSGKDKGATGRPVSLLVEYALGRQRSR